MSDSDEESDVEEDQEPIKWNSIIFLPYNRWWQFIIVATAFLKCIFGPMRAIYSFINCRPEELEYVLDYVTAYYEYLGDALYICDTFLYVIHRQVRDEAMKREYVPKSATCILLDLISLLPLFQLFSADICAQRPAIWPHILNFNELCVIYRIADFCYLKSTHSYVQILLGYTLLYIIMANAMVCGFLLATRHGLCSSCLNGLYDWRTFTYDEYEEKTDYVGHCYIWIMLTSRIINYCLDVRIPNTIAEFIIEFALILFGYLFIIFLILPKFFVENLLRLKPQYKFNPRVLRIIEETKNRNESPEAHTTVENYYSFIWTNRMGLCSIPHFANYLPWYLRVNIKLDLVWPIFHHSPVLRHTSQMYKRWLCEHVDIGYKLPGERFFIGPSCFSKLYYVKSGIVQLIAADDSTVPMLSVTSGTIFGDISFLIPPVNRKVIMRCLTYCEVLSISRNNILMSLHKFPKDRINILKLANEKMQHARDLFSIKSCLDLDRVERENIAWLKHRWWEISEAIESLKLENDPKKSQKIPGEDSEYHCAKYIGQLVLCSEVVIKRKSMFYKETFPWILTPHSNFVRIWYYVIKITATVALFVIPPNLTLNEVKGSAWYAVFSVFVDLLYTVDVLLLLLTSATKMQNEKSITKVIAQRCKKKHFILDVLSMPWVGLFLNLFDLKKYYYIAQYNRLFKTYMIFSNRFKKIWRKDKSYWKQIYLHFTFSYISYIYISAYLFFWIITYNSDLDVTFFYGLEICFPNSSCTSQFSRYGVFSVPIGWIKQIMLPDLSLAGKSLNKLILGLFLMVGYLILGIFWKTRVMAAIFLSNIQKVKYQTLVTNFRNYYTEQKIHPDLLTRLNRYLNCHWKYYEGKDVLHPDLMRDESPEVYWNLQGSTAEKIIGESKAFAGADPGLVKELASKAKFIIQPAQSIIVMFGVQIEHVSWLARIIYIQRHEFMNIIKKYDTEWSYFRNVSKEMGSFFNKIFVKSLKKHRNYQKSLRTRLFHGRQSVATISPLKKRRKIKIPVPKFLVNFRSDPESNLTLSWLAIRAIAVFLNIILTQFKDELTILFTESVARLRWCFDIIAVLDIFIKLILPYYDKRGIVITYIPKCALHYLSRGFIMDVVGTAVAMQDLISPIVSRSNHGSLALAWTTLQYSHLYLFIGFFNYFSDVPTNYSLYLKIIKWQLLINLATCGVASYLISMCINFRVELYSVQKHMDRLNESCWLPYYLHIDDRPSIKQLILVVSESIHFAQCALYSTFVGNFNVRQEKLNLTVLTFFGHIIYWYHMVYCMTHLLLQRYCNSNFENAVVKLEAFLKSERVDSHIINRAVRYLAYSWKRTKGQKATSLLHDRIGVVFRQDLTYYFYKKTFVLANMLLEGSESLNRLLSSCCTILYFLPDEDIVREMDLNYYIYFVHRGKVVVIKDNHRLAVLTKGSIFGPLNSRAGRAMRVTVRSLEQSDLLRVPIKKFQGFINDDVRLRILDNPQSYHDFLGVKKVIPESPYNSLQYLLRGKKIIKLPWMLESVTSETNVWYTRWLFATWVVNPVISSALVLMSYNLPKRLMWTMISMLLFLDFLHVIYMITEFYTMEIVVVDNQCIQRYVRLRHFTRIWMYIDVLSIILPLISLLFSKHIFFNLARLLRIHSVNSFNREMGHSLKGRHLVLLARIIMVVLLIHALTCGWMVVSCRHVAKTFRPLPEDIQLDPTEWVHPNERQRGCLRLTKRSNITGMEYFVVGQHWIADYLLALTYITIMQTHTNEDIVYPMTTRQIQYNIFANLILYLLEIWIGSIALSTMYLKFREQYIFDYRALTLTKYLKHCGINVFVQKMVSSYTRMLWDRQKGNWLPAITADIPKCLRQDIMGYLYIHHLMSNVLFQQLPFYFLRQLVVRLKRIVIFPGKIIVREGDMFPCIYFIHEGEIEEWYTDKNGESRLLSVLMMNQYFGLIPGLYPNVPYPNTYYSRTVVDLITLKLEAWEDLLNGYPEIKVELYNAARRIKH